MDQSSSSRHTATSPIEIEDDSQPIQGTASSWEKDQYYFGDHDPCDETFKPPERDSQDETMVFDTSKTRQQPHRIATTRKPARSVPEAIFSESHGMYTPPATNRRLVGKGTATGNSKGKEKVRLSFPCSITLYVSELVLLLKETPETSDPVDTPVPGPSRQQTHSRTPLTRRKSEIYADVPDITTKSSSSRAVAKSTSKPPSARGSGPSVEREKNWLSKRTAQGSASASARTNGIQTKMTAFIIDKAPNVVKNRKVSGAHVDVADGNFEDEDTFDESVRFVSMSKRGSSINADLSDDVVKAPVPKVAHASTSTRPLPRRKKRKSDEMDASSDIVVDGPFAAATDLDGDNDNELLSRLTAHKRFKKQHLLQAGADAISSENDADETSSLTSLSKGPSSDAQDIGEQEEARSGLRVKRGRAGRAMQVVYSSEPEENMMEMEVVAHKEPEKEPEVLRRTLSSIVPDSQPWHQYQESVVERFRVPSGPAKQQLPMARTAETESDTVQQDVDAIGSKRDDSDDPAEQVSNGVAAEPDVDMETESTQPFEASEEKPLQTASRALGPEESRTFPFPPEMLQELKAPVLRHNSSISLSSLRHSDPSQPEFAVPQYMPPGRDAFAAARQRILLSTDDDLESLDVQQPSRTSAHPILVQHRERDVFQEDPETQQSETLDFHTEMRKMLARPKRPVQLQANNSIVDTEAVAHIDTVRQRTANAQLSTRHTSAGPSDSAIPPVDAFPPSDTNHHANDDEGAASVDVIFEGDAELDEGTAPYAAPETETMLPLSLDTQLHRPGILSPNFQLRRRAVITNDPPSTKKTLAKRTPTKQQRFASPLVPPSKSVQTPQRRRNDVEARTLHEHVIPHAVLRSPESMIENVETLATWSPARHPTLYSFCAMNDQTSLAGRGKENVPFTFGRGSDSQGVAPDSPDEVVSLSERDFELVLIYGVRLPDRGHLRTYRKYALARDVSPRLYA